jgi:hypothetical protein
MLLILGSMPFIVASQDGISTAIEMDVVISTDLIGSSIDFERTSIVSRVTGEITFKVTPEGFADLDVCFHNGAGWSTESCQIPIVKKNTVLPKGYTVTTLDISDYLGGTFLDVRILKNRSVSICITTEIDDVQYSGHALVGADEIGQIGLEALTRSYRRVKTWTITGPEAACYAEKENAPSSIPQVRNSHEDSIKKTQNKTITGSRPPYVPEVYFLNHYISIFGSPWVVDIGDVLIDYSYITRELTREDPSMGQVKADLKMCSKHYYYRPFQTKTLGAYMVNSHGTFEEETEEVLFLVEDGWIDSEDVESCWISSDTYYCRPDACIVSMLTCYGLYYNSMGDAFMNYGARAYIGSDDTLPGNLNMFIEEFWGDNLAIGDTTINYALDNSFCGVFFDCYYTSCGTRTLPN